MAILSYLNAPFGFVMRFLSNLLGGNFAWAVFVFTLVINIVLIPLSIKSQKSTVQQTRIKPKLDDLKKRYGDDKQKYSEAMQKMYQEEGVSMSGGCLPMIVRLVLMFSIYGIILSPLTYMAGADRAKVDNVNSAITESMNELKKSDEDKYNEIVLETGWKASASNNQLGIIKIINEETEKGTEIVKKLMTEKKYSEIEADYKDIKESNQKADISYRFFGIDLTQTPKFSFNIFNEAQLIWLMPIIAFLSQMLSSVLSLLMQKKINPDAPNMAAMMLLMPLMSLFIGFSLPGGVAFYWACSSLIGGLVQIGVQNFYGPHKMLSRERAKELTRQCDFEINQIKKRNQAVSSGETEGNQ